MLGGMSASRIQPAKGNTMKRLISTAAAAVLIAVVSAGAASADEPNSVNIALFDMTAVAPGFVGGADAGAAGQGMMGMMGRGGFAQGVPGFGGGQGYGGPMMGGGYGAGMMGGGYGRGMMGMMGPGMMAIRADKPTVKAGTVTFNVTNWSRSLVHEMVVVAVDSPDAALPYDYSKQQVVEDQVKVLGETEELQPSASQALTLDLPAGNYLLICNLPGHYGSGMQMAFSVAG